MEEYFKNFNSLNQYTEEYLATLTQNERDLVKMDKRRLADEVMLWKINQLQQQSVYDCAKCLNDDCKYVFLADSNIK